MQALPVLQPMIDGIRSPYNKPKGGPEVAERMVALLDAVARALEGAGMALSASRKVLTARREQDTVDLRVVEQSKRASRPGEPYQLEPTGLVYVTTDNIVPWGPRLGTQRVMWLQEVGMSARDLARKVVSDVPEIFAARRRWNIAREEQSRRWAAEQAERDKVRQAAADLQARKERQDALMVRVIEQAARAREIRQFLAGAPRPQEGQGGYGCMLAGLASRLAELERETSPEVVEAAVKGQGLFPPPEHDG